ncbi:MAG: App1 family protein [Pirellulaceae bacterium]
MPQRLLTRIQARSALRAHLSADETVVLFPGLGHLEPDGSHWHVPIHGEVFANGRQVGLGKRFLLKMLQRAMKVPESAFQTDLFRQRIARFLAADCRGRQITVRLGEGLQVLTKKSRRNGHFFGSLRLPAEVAPGPDPSDCGGAARVMLEIHGRGEEVPAIRGKAYLLPATGLSVISDIDDTLKHSYVACKRTLLANTFLRRYEAIAGMSDLFRQWAAKGAAFHYVSSSPWQLYGHLADHLAQEGFPDGSFHLRAFRLRDHLMRRLLMLRRSGKAAVIRGILQTFPQRRFVLVGDSGEIDPEIYGVLARRFPQQVAGIYIRQIEGPGDTPARYQHALRGVPYEVVRLFHTAEELQDVRLELPLK